MNSPEPTIDNVSLEESPAIICTDCGALVRMLWTGEDEGVNVGCDCHQMDHVPYHLPLDDLRGPWQLGKPTDGDEDE